MEEDWYLDNEYTIDGVDPVGVTYLEPDLYVTDTTARVVQRYNTETKAIIKIVEDEKVGYINQRTTRVLLPMMELDSIFVYRGAPELYKLQVANKLNGPKYFDGFKINDFAISDAGNHRVIRKIGNVETIIGKKGSGVGELLNPEGIHFANNKLYVADSGNNRVQIFSSEGEYISALADGVHGEVSVISSDGKNLFLLDKLSNAIHVYSSAGDLLYTIKDFFVDPSYVYFLKGKLYIADRQGSTVKVLGNKKYDSSSEE